MSDNKLYTCIWKKTSKGFEVRSVDFPNICGQGKTLFSAEEQFAFRLSDKVQQWPAAIGYTIPPPADEEFAKFQSDWILIGGGNALLKQQHNLSKLFEDDACIKCGAFKGRRSSEPLSFEYSSSSIEDVAYVDSGSIGIMIYSKQFVDGVFEGVDTRFQLRPTVCMGKRCKKEYFELVSEDVVLPVVPRFCNETFRECTVCGMASVAGRFRVGELRYFFDDDEMRTLDDDFAILGQEPYGQLLVSLHKWRGVHSGEGLVGVSTKRVGLLPKSMHLGHAVDYQKAMKAVSMT